ncbi:MAG: hypothetical protein SNI58_03165 [Rikenellaceae bacterium]
MSSEFNVKDILSLVLRETLSGEERIPVSDTEYISVRQLVSLVAALGNIKLIKTNETTAASNSNAYSALRSLATFLRKDTADSANGLIKFLAGLEVGDAIDSMTAGKGSILDADGRAQFSRLEVRESMTVQELIYNRLSAMESDYVFSESGTIETIEQTSDTTYYVVMKKEWDYDFTAIEEDDIVKGVVNNLQSATGEYYTSWCRVLSKDASANALTLVVYDDDDVSGGQNYPPTAMMKLNRWGNISDENRQRVWYLSSSEGRIVFLTGVTKPIVERSNYSNFQGLPPSFFTNDSSIPINPNQPYFYARGAIIQDLFLVDYEGKPIATTVDRGVWSLATAQGDDPYLFEAYNSTTMRYESHEAWHNSIKWQCLDSETIAEPKWNSADWSALTGSFEITITPTNGVYFFKGSNVYTTLTAKVYNGDADISEDIADTQVEWTRISSKSDEDLAWGILRKDDGLALVITPDDLPSDWLETKQVSFKCTVSLLEATVITEEFNIS